MQQVAWVPVRKYNYWIWGGPSRSERQRTACCYCSHVDFLWTPDANPKPWMHKM
jgi:hypothetical protein